MKNKTQKSINLLERAIRDLGKSCLPKILRGKGDYERAIRILQNKQSNFDNIIYRIRIRISASEAALRLHPDSERGKGILKGLKDSLYVIENEMSDK